MTVFLSSWQHWTPVTCPGLKAAAKSASRKSPIVWAMSCTDPCRQEKKKSKKEEVMEQLYLKVLACAFPTPAHAYYHIRVKVSGTKTNLKVNRIEGNGKWIRDFVVVHEDKAAS